MFVDSINDLTYSYATSVLRIDHVEMCIIAFSGVVGGALTGAREYCRSESKLDLRER